MSNRRRSIRLPEYDYTKPGWYFVTICTRSHESLFGSLKDDCVELNQLGYLAKHLLCEIPDHFPHVSIDSFVIMPDHIHVVFNLWNGRTYAAGRDFGFYRRGDPWVAPTTNGTQMKSVIPARKWTFSGPPPGSVCAIIGQYKSSVTRMIKRMNTTSTMFQNQIPALTRHRILVDSIWQRNYYERIIRSRQELDGVREYIRLNPIHHSRDEARKQ